MGEILKLFLKSIWKCTRSRIAKITLGGKKAPSYRTNPTTSQDFLQSYNNQDNVVFV